jgi:hypothetical protein
VIEQRIRDSTKLTPPRERRRSGVLRHFFWQAGNSGMVWRQHVVGCLAPDHRCAPRRRPGGPSADYSSPNGLGVNRYITDIETYFGASDHLSVVDSR